MLVVERLSSGKERLLVRGPLARSVPAFLPRTGSHGSRCARLRRKKSAARQALPRSGAREKAINLQAIIVVVSAPWKLLSPLFSFLCLRARLARPLPAFYSSNSEPLANGKSRWARPTACLAWREASRGGLEARRNSLRAKFQTKLIFSPCSSLRPLLRAPSRSLFSFSHLLNHLIRTEQRPAGSRTIPIRRLQSAEEPKTSSR